MKKESITLSWGIRIAIVYTLFAVSTVGFVAFAMTRDVELVRKDYYEFSLNHDKTSSANQLGRSVESELHLTMTSGGLESTLPPSHRESTGTLTLYRPNAQKLDRTSPFVKGNVVIPRTELQQGRYNVFLAWEYSGQQYQYSTKIAVTD